VTKYKSNDKAKNGVRIGVQSFNVLDLKDSNTWNIFYSNLSVEKKDIYYTPEYYRLYEELGDGRARCFVFKDGDEVAIYPFLLNSINALGYDLDKEYCDIQGAYGYNGVATTTFNDQFIRSFYLAFDDYCKNENIIAEFTRFNPLLKNHLFSENKLQVFFDRKTIWLDLSKSYDKIFMNFQTTTRKQIKRATNRYNLEVRIFENDISILDDFYYIYHEAMTRVQAIPYLFFNRSYFKLLFESTQSTCFMAFHEKKPVACILAFYTSFYINGHLGGVLKDYLHMSPFSLLYAEMIKFGQRKNCKYLHIGGGAALNPDDPLLKFKMNFSRTTADFYIGKRIFNPLIYNTVIRQWESKYPGKIEPYKNLLLKYRY
jgi:hypothetical protein